MLDSRVEAVQEALEAVVQALREREQVDQAKAIRQMREVARRVTYIRECIGDGKAIAEHSDDVVHIPYDLMPFPKTPAYILDLIDPKTDTPAAAQIYDHTDRVSRAYGGYFETLRLHERLDDGTTVWHIKDYDFTTPPGGLCVLRVTPDGMIEELHEGRLVQRVLPDGTTEEVQQTG